MFVLFRVEEINFNLYVKSNFLRFKFIRFKMEYGIPVLYSHIKDISYLKTV